VEEAKKIKKCAVVGRGLAGMQASITLKNRGMKLTFLRKAGLAVNLTWLILPLIRNQWKP